MPSHLDDAVTEWGVAVADAGLAVLTIHGRSQSPTFMQQTAERFGPAPVRFFAPEAKGNSWYPYRFMEPISKNQPDVDQALSVVERCLEQLNQIGFPPDRVVLWGFSQGACLLSHYALTAPQQFAGLILFTGGYIGAESRDAPEGQPLRDVPAILRSIEHDPWVPRSRVEETAALLSHAGATVDLRIDPGTEHIITDEACAAATGLLTASNR